MKIRLTADIQHKGYHYSEGEVATLPDDEARHLIAINRAEPLDQKVAVGKNAKGEIVTREPKVENRDPKGPKSQS